MKEEFQGRRYIMNTYHIRKLIIRDLSIPPKHICCYHGKQITDDMILYDLTDKEIFDLWDTINMGLKIQNFTKSNLRDRMVVETRAQIKEVTMSEVEEKFGCKVKIIND